MRNLSKMGVERNEHAGHPEKTYGSSSQTHGVYRLFVAQIKEILSTAGYREEQGVALVLPGPALTWLTFKLWKRQDASSEVNSERFEGYNERDRSTEMLLTVSPLGLNAMIATATSGTWFISPVDTSEDSYMVYRESDLLGRNH